VNPIFCADNKVVVETGWKRFSESRGFGYFEKTFSHGKRHVHVRVSENWINSFTDFGEFLVQVMLKERKAIKTLLS